MVIGASARLLAPFLFGKPVRAIFVTNCAAVPDDLWFNYLDYPQLSMETLLGHTAYVRLCADLRVLDVFQTNRPVVLRQLGGTGVVFDRPRVKST
jgi:hypothetical protein